MKFIEMTGSSLFRLVEAHELRPDDLKAAGVGDDTMVRINEQGDIEVRRPHGWDVIGGLIGDFDRRVKQLTNLNWA